MFQFQLLNNTAEEWLLAAAIATVVTLALYLVRSVLMRHLGAIAARTETQLDDMLVSGIKATRVLLMVVLGIYVGTTVLELSPRWEQFFTRAAIAALLVQCAIWGDRAVRRWVRNYRASNTRDPARTTSTAALGFILRILLWVVIVLMILDNLGFNITTLVASLGIGGVAVALAVQNILGDLFASLSIVIDKPFVIGDFINVEGQAMGTVEYVGLKTTRVRALDGEQIVFSNNKLLNSRIHNIQRLQSRRVAFVIGVVQNTPKDLLAEVPRLIGDIIRARQPRAGFDRAHFFRFGPSSLDFEIVYYFNDPDFNMHMDMQQEIFLEIHGAFQERGIKLAVPVQAVRVDPVSPMELVSRDEAERVLRRDAA
ncbi:mechanosensitive ion channel family protein [Zemynaea arenosa]|nr:mechanosensitive ion channel family protein [Massilia arenosa]